MLQAGWGITPQVIVEKRVFNYEYGTLDLEDIFDGKTLVEVISTLTERYEFLVSNRGVDLDLYDIKFKTEYDYDSGGTSVALWGKRQETDGELAQRKNKLDCELFVKEAQERETLKRLKAKYEGETNNE